MIEENEVFEVTRIEFHHLLTCPCRECVDERRRRRKQVVMKPDQARIMGLIPDRLNAGSVVRELANK